MSLPERLGRLSRVRRLGAGGFATVWLYRDDELRSFVAVKALADNWAQRLDVRERFLEEARILRAADSDHVVRVHDIGETDGTPWFVMSYADRGSLDRHLTPGAPLPPTVVLPVVAQAASGLAVLHERGIVHRDVKPQNLLLRADGVPDPEPREPAAADLTTSRLLVADLGVAKAVLHASGLTQVVGTPAYMAPEQATGEPVGPASDVHALAAVTYQMLTGRLLRDGGLGDLVDGAPPVPPTALADLPEAVDRVLLRAVHPRPEERWPDVRSFVAALDEALAGGPVLAAPAPPVTVVRRPPAGPADPPAPSAAGPEEQRTSPAAVVLLVLLVLGVSFGVSFAAFARWG